MADPKIVQDPNPLSAGNVAHFLGNAANSALFNAGDLIPGVKDYLDDPRYAGAKGAGELAGLGASLFIPGGILAKGAGLGLKGVGAAKSGQKLLDLGNFMAGAGKTNLATNVGRGALVGAEQAVPRALIASTPQGGGQSIEDAVTQAAVGTALGAGLGGLGGAAGNALKKLVGTGKPGGGGIIPNNIVEAVKDETAHQAVGAITGGSARAARQWGDELLKGYGPMGKAIATDDAIQNLANFVARKGLRNNQDIEAYHKDLEGIFDLSRARINPENTPFFKAPTGGIKEGAQAEIPQWLKQSKGFDRLENALSMEGIDDGGSSMLTDYLKNLQEGYDFAYLKSPKDAIDAVTAKLRNDAMSSVTSTPEQRIRGWMAGTIKDALQEHGMDLVKDTPEAQALFSKLGVKNLDEAKGDYRDLGIFRWINRMQGSKMEPPFTPNSDTSLKQAMSMLGPAAAGGVVGGAPTGYDPTNPMTWAGIGSGFLLGNVAAKGLNAMSNRIIGETALNLNQALQEPGSKVAQNLQNIQALMRGQLAPSAQKAIASGAPGLPGKAIQPTMAITAQQDQAMAQDASVNQAALPPGYLRSQTYQNTVEGVVDRLYRQIFLSSGDASQMANAPTKQEFAQQLAIATSENGVPYSPEKMVKLLFPQDDKAQASFIKSYQKLKQVSQIDPERDLISKAVPMVGGILDPVTYDVNLNNLALSLVQPDASGNYDPKKAQTIRNSIDSIIRGWGTVAQKKQLIQKVIQGNLGAMADVAGLQRLGLTEGTILGGGY